MHISRLRTTLFKFALIALFLTSAVPGARADLLQEIKNKGVIVIGTEARFPPFEYVEDGKIVGYSADLLEIVMQGLPDVKVKRLDIPWQGILPGLEARKFDFIVTSVTATKERFNRYALSAPIADATVALLVRADSSIAKPEDVAGLTVGSQSGSAQLQALQALDAQLKAAGEGVGKIVEYVGFDEAYADLAAGRIQAVAQSFPNLADAVKNRPDMFRIITPPFGTKKYFSWAARKDADSASLSEFFDARLKELNDSGKMLELQKKWFGFEMPVPVTLPEPTE